MADTVCAVSLLPDQASTDGAMAIGANSLTIIAADRLSGFRCATIEFWLDIPGGRRTGVTRTRSINCPQGRLRS